MDNVTHTLAGAILAEAGLGRRTRLGTATLLIGANLPDVDALAYLRDPLVRLYDLRYARPEAPSWAAVDLQAAR